jgi:hypothetical protein
MAETHYYRGEGGVVWPYDLPLPEPIQEKVTKGYLRRVHSDGSPWAPPAAEAVDPGDQRPGQAAVKAEWVGYAVRVHGADADEADGMTKADLIEKYGRD